MRHPPKRTQTGFTLLEIAAVIILIGLAIGALLMGKEMIANARLQSLISDIQHYNSAVSTFRTRYNCLPGDCPFANRFLSVNSTTPATCAAYTGLTQSCNGDGNGMIDGIISGNYTEMFYFWQHLALTGIIPGAYQGVPYGGIAAGVLSGTNSPAFKLGEGFCMDAMYYGTLSGDTNRYDGIYGNVLEFGYNDGTTGSGRCVSANSMLTPSQAYTVDTKIDDGMPGTGMVRSWKPAWSANCASGATSAATYVVSYTGSACPLIIIPGF